MAAAAAAAAQAVAALIANQAIILQQLQAQQILLQQQIEDRDGSKKEPEELQRGAANYNPWSLGVTSYLAKRKRDWAVEMTDAQMLAHPNYPPDAPPDPANPAAQAAAQAEVLVKRRKVQTDLHDLLTRTCKVSYYSECSAIQLSFPNCGSMLWRSIYLANNPDGEEQTNSLRAGMKAKIASFKGEWDNWIKDIEILQTQLIHLNEPFSEREFRELIFMATAKVSGWETWTEMKLGSRPPLNFYQIKQAGQAKWAALHQGEVTDLLTLGGDKKKEMVAFAAYNYKNCKDAHCTHDHGDLKYCSYHGKWTGHVRENCQMLKEDIALQREAKQLRGRGRGGDRGRGRGGGRGSGRGTGRGAPAGRGSGKDGGGGKPPNADATRGRGGGRGRGRTPHFEDEPDSEEEIVPKTKKHRANHIVHCAMVMHTERVKVKNKRVLFNDGARGHALVDSGCTSHLHPDASALVNVRACDKTGDWSIKVQDEHGQWVSTLFKNVLVCDVIDDPIISVQKMRVWGHDVVYSDSVSIVLNARSQEFDPITLPLNQRSNSLCYLKYGPDRALESEHVLAGHADAEEESDEEPPSMCDSDSDSDDEGEIANLAVPKSNTGARKPQPVSAVEEESDEEPPPLAYDTESDSEVEDSQVNSQQGVRREDDADGTGGPGVQRKTDRKTDDVDDDDVPADNITDIYTNQQLDPKLNDKFQRIAARLHYDSNHTSIQHLMKIAPVTPALQELLAFPSNFEMRPCPTCDIAKARQSPLPGMATRAPYPNYRWFADLTGKMRVKSWGGHQYCGVVVDDYSGEIQPIKCKLKSDFASEYDRVVRQQGVTPKYLRTDGGGENMGEEFEKRVAADGTFHEKSAADWQNQNGRAESGINRVGTRANAMSRHCSAPSGVFDRAWDYACLCESATKPYRPGKAMTSYEAKYGRQFDFKKLVPFGCLAVPFVKKHKRRPGKNADRAKPGIFVGYGHSEGYSACLILDPATKRIARVPFEQIKFYRDEYPWRNPKGQRWPPLHIVETPDEYTVPEEGEVMCPESNEPFVLSSVRTRARAAADEAQQQLEKDRAKVQEERASLPTEQPPDEGAAAPALGAEPPPPDPQPINVQEEIRDGASIYFDEALPVFCGFAVKGSLQDPRFLPDPKDWDEAMGMPDWKDWVKSAKAERRNLRQRQSFRVLKLREVKRLIAKKVKIHTAKNVMKKKINAQGNPYRHKSRASFRGFTEIPRFDFHETFAAVASSAVVRLIVALGIGAGLTIRQLDVVGAYLYAPMAEELYMWAPEGIAKFEGECWQLLSQIYGTRQAGAGWKDHFVKLLKEFGFVAVNMDETLFVLRDEVSDRVIILCLYVDDAILEDNWPSRVNKLLQFLATKIEVTDEGALHWYLAVSYKYNLDGTKIFAGQTAYIEKVARAHGIDPNAQKGPSTPMDARFTVRREDVPNDDEVDLELRTKVKRLLGSLLFPSGWCRPDCSYATHRLARHAAKPWQDIYDAALRILKYMVATKDYGIQFSKLPEDRHGHKLNELYCFVDSSFADDPINSRSTIGYVIFMNGGPVAYKTKLAPTLVGSSTHAELAAACMASQDVVQLRAILAALGFPQDGPTPMYEDNESCIAIANNKRSTHNKHIDVCYEIIREYVRKMEIVFVSIGTADQLADFLTKALGKVKFKACADGVVVDGSEFYE
eukprot:CAMPEP_0181343174 /NCGR_PEP_ID=MMETSP1101-20121128/31437_1 /TAXON_ID=46948 /ORGANISM="Rhodomonas abbreviata, Strain Caron Lab Isolate" /LENGTH=1673 /DNA_ID=CAMNT_0023454769 /DNA_START=92 /DNA_END=5115 /DNA_ORIENTATION=-